MVTPEYVKGLLLLDPVLRPPHATDLGRHQMCCTRAFDSLRRTRRPVAAPAWQDCRNMGATKKYRTRPAEQLCLASPR